jgi:hypothetical protein
MTTERAIRVGLLSAPVVSRFGWRRLVVALVGPLVLAGVLGVGQARAQLPANCSQSGGTVTCMWSFTGAEQSFSVPPGINSVQMEAVGAPGGPGAGASGGAGAVASGTLSATGGQTLYIEVGGAGSGQQGAPGFNGGGVGRVAAGGGGGSSDVRTAPCLRA